MKQPRCIFIAWRLGAAFFCLFAAACQSNLSLGETPAEAKLAATQAQRLSAASASVAAAQRANAANPAAAPKAAVAGELSVAAANLPVPKPADVHEAQARVDAALAGKLADAQTRWAEAAARGNELDAEIARLQMRVASERATAVAAQRNATGRLCVLAALMVGGALFVLAALSLAAGMYFGITKLQYGAAGLAAGGAAAFFAATQVGTEHFNVLATIILAGGVGALAYVIWHGFAGGRVIKAKARGFDSAVKAKLPPASVVN